MTSTAPVLLPGAPAAIRNPEKLPSEDLSVLASVTYEVRALNDGVTHEPFGSPAGPGLWHHKGKQLPAYIQQVAHGLRKSGMTESRAIATAVSRCKVWCAGGDGVKADTRAKACAAVAEWEALKVSAAWDDAAHPRAPAGETEGGQFAPAGQGKPGSKAPAKPGSKAPSGKPPGKTPIKANPAKQLAHFLHLAHLAHLLHRGQGKGPSPAEVMSAQRQLNQALGLKLAVDGDFGPKTLAAIKQFQAKHGPPAKKVPIKKVPARKVPLKTRMTAATADDLLGQITGLLTAAGWEPKLHPRDEHGHFIRLGGGGGGMQPRVASPPGTPAAPPGMITAEQHARVTQALARATSQLREAKISDRYHRQKITSTLDELNHVNEQLNVAMEEHHKVSRVEHVHALIVRALTLAATAIMLYLGAKGIETSPMLDVVAGIGPVGAELLLQHRRATRFHPKAAFAWQ